MSDYDKAGRYLIKQDPAGFFRWLFGAGAVAFHAWIDARRLALPDQGDLTSDLVAAFRAGDTFEAACVELQAPSRENTAERLLGYVSRLWTEPAAGSLPLRGVGAAVVNLTGPPQPTTVRLRLGLAPGCRLDLDVHQITLRNEDAGALLEAVGSGTASRWLLAWLPLLRGGDDAGIMRGWRREALRLTDERRRSVLGGLTLTFAELAQRLPTWQEGLRGWNVEKSPYLESLREAERAEGRAEGRLAERRDGILLVGRHRFGRAASRKQRAELDAITDLDRLERIRDRLLEAETWADLLATP